MVEEAWPPEDSNWNSSCFSPRGTEYQTISNYSAILAHGVVTWPETRPVSFQPSTPLPHPQPGWITHSLSQVPFWCQFSHGSAPQVSWPLFCGCTKIPWQRQLKGGSTSPSTHSSRVQSIVAGKSRQRPLEATAHITATVRKQRAMNACSAPLLHLHSPGPH